MRTGKICGAVWEAQAVNRHIQGVDQNCFFCNVTLLKWRIGLDCLADPHHMIRLHQMNPKANQIHIFRYTKIFHKKKMKISERQLTFIITEPKQTAESPTGGAPSGSRGRSMSTVATAA